MISISTSDFSGLEKAIDVLARTSGAVGTRAQEAFIDDPGAFILSLLFGDDASSILRGAAIEDLPGTFEETIAAIVDIRDAFGSFPLDTLSGVDAALGATADAMRTIADPRLASSVSDAISEFRRLGREDLITPDNARSLATKLGDAFAGIVEFSLTAEGGLAGSFEQLRDLTLREIQQVEDFITDQRISGMQEASKKIGRAALEIEDERANRLKFAGEEVRLRTRLQERFQTAGGDVFEQRRAFEAFKDAVEGLRRQERLARGRTTTGAVSTSPAARAAAGGGATGSGGTDSIIVPFTDVIDLTTATADSFGVSHWGGIVDLTALRGNREGVQYVIPWSEAIDLVPGTAEDFGVFHWGGIVNLTAIRGDDNSSVQFVIPWSEVISLTPITIDDWSDIFNFSALPPILEDINIGIHGHDDFMPNNRTLIAIRKTTIDDWSDILNFSTLPPLLENIGIGIVGQVEGSRDMIRIRPIKIVAWEALVDVDPLPRRIEIEARDLLQPPERLDFFFFFSDTIPSAIESAMKDILSNLTPVKIPLGSLIEIDASDFQQSVASAYNEAVEDRMISTLGGG